MIALYGHRGARGEAPENTLASFRQCLAQGVDRCELDLHLSRDGELVVIHDPTLTRTTGRTGRVSDLDVAELTQLDARRGGPGWPEPCPIPTLGSLFEQCAFSHWQLEVKSASVKRARALVVTLDALVRRYALIDQVTLTSSSRTVLQAARELAPQLSLGLVAEGSRIDPIETAKGYGCSLLAIEWTLCTPSLVQDAQQQGLHVSSWTVNDPETMQRLADMGVDSLITDYPGLAKAVLERTATTPA
ncbi:glycerophosphodiester phosphodiesterase [Stutzerimonas urumqiensis]|uniref:glycerophosphodiester phosphodiesterase n=1 Tax=Stutzerimonas urumqiensis TaxID=638269 RepID=UPI003DA6918D